MNKIIIAEQTHKWVERCDELNKENQKLKKQLEIVKKYLTLIKRNVSIGSLVYTYVSNAQTDIKMLENEKCIEDNTPHAESTVLFRGLENEE